MTTELTMLAWGCVLALLHILIAAQAKTRQYGRHGMSGHATRNCRNRARSSAG